MIPTLDIRHDMNRLVADLGLMKAEILPAAVSALNKTLTTVRAQAARALRDEYPGFKASVLKRQMRFKRASRLEPRAVLTFSNKRLRLFGNKRLSLVQTRYGTGVRLGKLPFRLETADGSAIDPADLRRAFVQRSRASRVPNVWLRKGKALLPIDVVLAPSLSSAVVEKRIGEALLRVARTRFAVVFAQEGRFRLAKRR